MENIIFHNTITEKGKPNPFPGREPCADVCLLLEGTYPFVSGGVSSWVHSLIRGMPEKTFSLYVILPDKKKRKLAYDIPENVKGLYLHFLNHDSFYEKTFSLLPKNEQYLSDIVKFHQNLPQTSQKEMLEFARPSDWNLTTLEEEEKKERFFEAEYLKRAFKDFFHLFEKQNRDIPSRVFSRKTWQKIIEIYHTKNLTCSFVDYYWTWRHLHFGIFSILNSFIPQAKIYHAVSTGYAGLVGTKASLKFDAPLILTEHGIYNKERKIDISRSRWIYEERRHRFRAQENLEIFKEIWIKAFTIMAKICYASCSSIITLYSGNQLYQRMDGANPEVMEIIPNGVDFAGLSLIPREPQSRKIIGFVGRIVPIKDVKTFLRAVSLVLRAYPNAEAWLMGPVDENRQYYEECLQLVEFLEIEKNVRFTGMVDLTEYYPKLDVLVLTSISEAQPLVILEAYALGIPVVATDVGACRELIEGSPGEDFELGRSGLLTSLTNPAETAFSILHLLKKPEAADKMGQIGKKRVQKYYDLPKLFERYRQLYDSHLN